MVRALVIALAGLLPGSGAVLAAEDAPDERLVREAGVPVTAPGLLQFFRDRTLSPADREKLNALIRQLGEKNFRAREKAFEELTRRGTAALPALRQALGDRDAEVVRQARDCIQAIERGPGAAVPAAAVRLLRARKPDGALAVLLAYLPAADSGTHDEILDALPVLGVQGNAVDAALVAALKDPAPERRAAAALVVGRSGTPEQRAAVRRLLDDRDPRVRLRAAQGLIAGGDKTAVPVLVTLVGDAPADVAEAADDLIARLAGKQAPAPVRGGDAAARRQRRADWDAWWKSHEGQLDLARADLAVIGTPSRIREVVRKFLDSVVKGDAALFRQTTELPFWYGPEEIRTEKELNGVFEDFRKEVKDGQLTFALGDLASVQHYATVMHLLPRDPVLKLRQPGVRVVYIAVRKKGMPDEALAAFVRTRGGPPRVIGLNEGPAR